MTTKTLVPQTACPSDEDMAALLDGALPEADRDRVARHVASCPDCFELYAGVARLKLDQETPIPKVRPFPVERVTGRRRLLLPIAALLAIAFGLPLYRSMQSVRLTSAGLVEAFAGSARAAEPWEWARYRSAEPAPAPGPEDWEVPFVRLGALLVDLRVALQAGDARTASELYRRIGGTVEQIRGEKQAAPFYETGEKAAAPAALPGLLADLERQEAELDGKVSSDFLSFGKWTEAGRIAAASRAPAFFEGRNRRFLSTFLRQEDEELDPEVREPLQAVQEIWDRGDLQDDDLEEIAGHLGSILRYYDP
ncbi:MAG TPA: zf-HC2 domain-containing protein [Thermoanaerobaculia bacterium]|nr:zf-HC2 domain-containing protein [Thermoanaerobaculia bacterium]